MGNCLVTKLKAEVNMDNPHFLDALMITLVGSPTATNNRIKADNAILTSGTLYTDETTTTVALNEGDILANNTMYFFKEGETVKVKALYKQTTQIDAVSSLSNYSIKDFGYFEKLFSVYFRFSGIGGDLEDFVERLCQVKTDTNNVYMDITNTAIKLHGSSVGDNYNLIWNNGVVSICKKTDASVIYATYTIATNTWWYPQE